MLLPISAVASIYLLKPQYDIGSAFNHQRRAGLQQLQAQQPRLAVKADILEDKKTSESREDFAPDGRLEDISPGQVHNDPFDQLR